MSFIYSCIGDNFPENREWLDKIGYNNRILYLKKNEYDIIISVFFDNDTYSYMEVDKEELEVWVDSNKCNGIETINCIGNPQLFQAVTAMRDDSDYMQWFVTEANQSWVNQDMYIPKGSFELCLLEDRYMGQDPIFCSTIVPAHKATLEELEEHFRRV
ncbi:hypothetical protein IR083_21060 [Dysgonomonas sp. GY75]|uniref:hypothetical protein n=1 Tax=Dysgonomonas sp. GY75 TaxID=2780419 RepID=UPI00188323D8|nr:hypothetical protein [Dysgonomonas sp. GY75]MBF0651311.1 hypothetical protein [Dysgonomonas sp. GY75]